MQSRHGTIHPDLRDRLAHGQRLAVRCERRVELPSTFSIMPRFAQNTAWAGSSAIAWRNCPPPRQSVRLRPVPVPSGNAPRHCQDAPAARVQAAGSPPRRRHARAAIRQAVAQSQIVRRQRKARAVLRLDEGRLVLRDQHAAPDRGTDARSRRAPVRRGSGSAPPQPPRPALRSRGQAAATPRCRRVVAEQFVADALGLPGLATLQQGQRGMQPRQALRRLTIPLLRHGGGGSIAWAD